jgi:hypothetical protein
MACCPVGDRRPFFSYQRLWADFDAEIAERSLPQSTGTVRADAEVKNELASSEAVDAL